MRRQTLGARRLDESADDLEFEQSVLRGLSAQRKFLECKYFYDERGSALFDQICRQPEYYPTATEIRILEDCAEEVAEWIGPGAELVELGSGASLKTRIVLRALQRPARYVPVDISADYLQAAVDSLPAEFPGLEVRPLIADFTAPFRLPPRAEGVPRLLFFPGSTLGNFHPADASAFLRDTCRGLSADALLIGVDLEKDPAVLDAAYNDAAGVTAAFNLNLLKRINRELGADFRLEDFAHEANYVEGRHRVEMHLRSLRDQTVRLGRREVRFAAGERIHTENSYKYSVEAFCDLAEQARWRRRRTWTDEHRLFSVHLLEPV
ncbi:MAG: L-histidine N(alpha)-methyltransferase [Myxococcota bacterium]